MTTTRIETLLSIKAIDQYSSTLRNMAGVTGRFADQVRSQMGQLQGLRGSLRLIEDFRKQQQVVRASAEALAKAREKTRQLQHALETTHKPTAKMRQEFDRARKAAELLEQKHQKNRQILSSLHGELRAASVNTSNLAAEERRLAGSTDTATSAFGRQIEKMQSLARLQGRLAAAREHLNRNLATAANVGISGQAAIQTGQRMIRGTSKGLDVAGDYEASLIQFQNLSGIDDARKAKLQDELALLGSNSRTGFNSAELLEGLKVLVGKGMDLEVALTALSATARAAKATGSHLGEMADSGYAVQSNLGVSPEDMKKTYDVMAQAGKDGGFELAAMAKHFPELTAGARALGMEGTEAAASLAAALQVAMRTAGSEDQAATNMANFVGKMTSPETVKRFTGFGVDIEREMKYAAENGIDPIEHMVGLVQKVTGGDAFRMSEIFSDKQALDFLRALTQNMEEYRTIKETALAADGVVDADFNRVMAGFDEQVGQLKSDIHNLFTAQTGLLPVLTGIVTNVRELVRALAAWSTEHPRLTKYLILGTLAVGALAVAGGALLTAAAGLVATLAVLRFGLVGLWVRAIFAGGKVASLAAGIARAGRSGSGLARIGTSLAAFTGGRAGAIRLVGSALRAIAGVTGLRVVATGLMAFAGVVGTISAPVWAGIAAAVAAVGVAWKYWDHISSIASGVASAIGERLQPVLEAIKPVLEFLLPVVDGVKAAFSGIGAAIADVASGIRDFFSGGLFSQEVLTDEEKARLEASAAEITGKMIDAITSRISEFFQLGREIIMCLWDGVRAEFKGFIEWVQGFPAQIIEAIGSVDLSSIIDWPEPPEWWTYLFGEEALTVPAPTVADAPGGAVSTSDSRAHGLHPRSGGQAAYPARTHSSDVQKRARGGSFFGLKPLLVGENGPEMYFPDRAGFIANNGALQRMMLAAGQLRHMMPVAHDFRTTSLALATSSALAAMPAAAGQPAGLAPGGQQPMTMQVDIGSINITAPAGVSDPAALVSLLERSLGDRLAATIAASFSD